MATSGTQGELGAQRERLRTLWREAGFSNRAALLRAVDRELTRIAEHDADPPATLSDAAFHRMETGQVKPRGDVLVAIARALRVPAGKVLGLACSASDVPSPSIALGQLRSVVDASARVHEVERPGAREFRALSLALTESCVETARELAARLNVELRAALGEFHDLGDGAHVAEARALALELARHVEALCSALPGILRDAAAPRPRELLLREGARHWRGLTRAVARLVAPVDLDPGAWWPDVVSMDGAAQGSWLLDVEAAPLAVAADLLSYRALDVRALVRAR